MRFKAEVLNTTTWWWLGICLVLMASLSYSQPILLGICILSITLILLFAKAAKKAAALRLYSLLCTSVITIRLLFRLIFNTPIPGQSTVLNLPTLSFHLGGVYFSVLGPIADTTISSALTDGLRLCAIILGVAMANTVANPRKLLRSTPSALYEVATAAAVAVNLAPQLLASLQRVRRARQLRGHTNSLRNLKGILIPVLEDTIEKSLALAASMDSRGFGRRGVLSKRLALISRVAMLAGIVLVGFASYLLLATAQNTLESLALIAVALVFFASSLRIAGLHAVRSKLTLEVRRLADFAVLALATCAVAFLALGHIPALQMFSWLR